MAGFRDRLEYPITASEASRRAGFGRWVGPRWLDRKPRLYANLCRTMLPVSSEIPARRINCGNARATTVKMGESATSLLMGARIDVAEPRFAAILGVARVHMSATMGRLIARLKIASRSRRCTYALPCCSEAVTQGSAGASPSRYGLPTVEPCREAVAVW
jgi:hypothetical protein